MALFFRISKSWKRVVMGALLCCALGYGQPGSLLSRPAYPDFLALGQVIPPVVNEPPGHTLSPKQKRELLKTQFEKMKQNADELADLAKSLQDDLSKSNENVLSLQIVEKADKIEKLARKIKSQARGF